MRALYLIPLALLLAGCSPSRASTAALTVEQATELACRLANQQAQARYTCQPFRNSPPAQQVDGSWVWHDRRGQGNVDLEATVKFGPDGKNPNVSVVLLDSRAIATKVFP